MLKDIEIIYENNRYVVIYTRTRYYFGFIKGYDYIAIKEEFKTLEDAKYSIIQQLSDGKFLVSKKEIQDLSYADVLRKNN